MVGLKKFVQVYVSLLPYFNLAVFGLVVNYIREEDLDKFLMITETVGVITASVLSTFLGLFTFKAVKNLSVLNTGFIPLVHFAQYWVILLFCLKRVEPVTALFATSILLSLAGYLGLVGLDLINQKELTSAPKSV